MHDTSYSHSHPGTFTVFLRAPIEARFQQIGGLTPVIIVCDRENAWVYSPPLKRYRTQPAAEGALCSPIVGNWKSLSRTLKSPVLAGSRTVEIGGRKTNCEVVRGKSEATPPLSGDINRELCIDAKTNLVASEQYQYGTSYGYLSRTYTYSKIERDIDMLPDMFVLKLPPGIRATPYDLPVPEPFDSLGMPPQPGISMPRVLKQEPVYTRARIWGTVVLYVVIDTNGVASEIDVFRHLTPEVEASAIQAMKQWRFAPAMKDDKPIALGTLIEVDIKHM